MVSNRVEIFRLTVISFLVFCQCASVGFAVPADVSSAQVGSVQTTEGKTKVQSYEQLVTAIRGARAESKVRVERAVEQERVREAWEIGKLIDEHILQRKERAAYAKNIFPRLAADLGISERELYYMIKFTRAYPILPRASQLSWSEYRELLSVKNAQARQTLADRAGKENWSRERLRAEVKAAAGNEKSAGLAATETLTPPEMGQPGTYKIILAKTGPYAGELALDLGFSNYFRLSEILGEDLSAYKEGNMVVFYGQEVQVLGRSGTSNVEHLRYTYNAWVVRVLDGDTFEAVVDLGFGMTTTQTLRLRGIDVPEILTRDGQEAKAFVEKLLTPGTSISIKTTRSDKYDRYLVDVFVTDSKSGEDKYLNSLLLEKGLAVIVQS